MKNNRDVEGKIWHIMYLRFGFFINFESMFGAESLWQCFPA